jgi:dCMP deaminase
MSVRPDVDTYWLDVVEGISARGECLRSKVGALLVNKLGRLRGSGVNGVAPGEASCLDGACPRGLLSYEEQPPGGSYGNCISVHAENNLLINSTENDLIGGTVYLTRAPCNGCGRLLRIARVARVVWRENGKKAEISL